MTHELTLYFIPSPYGLSWNSPSSITKTTILNRITLKNRNIGHVAVEIKTDTEHILTGMAGDVRSSKKLLFFEGIGLGMLYYNYPGRLESKEELEEEFKIQAKHSRLNFVSFKISSETSARLIQYLSEYKERRCEVRYGLPNQPRLAEGAGCSAFGVSFLELAGILDEEFKKAWSYDLAVPEHVVGTPIGTKKVNVLQIFLTHTWAKSTEPHRKIFFWDPDTMFAWVNRKLIQPGPYEQVFKHNVQGLLYDRSQIPTPTNPIWKR
ncbi:MAG: hypothetical protein ACOYL6_11985 [Bacteriovoracaceae bacterium]